MSHDWLLYDDKTVAYYRSKKLIIPPISVIRDDAPRMLAIDPGTTHSGWALIRMHDRAVLSTGKHDNRIIVVWLANSHMGSTFGEGWDFLGLSIEKIVPHQRMGRTTLDTVHWCGRFEQAYHGPVRWKERAAVKKALLGEGRWRDSDVRQRIIDLYTKTSEGPRVPRQLHLVAGDAWQALGLGISVLGQPSLAET